MPDIRYVCLSDLHFGEEDSLLTELKTGSTDIDPTRSSSVMKQLVKCLRYLISQNESDGKPTLVLCGDILELALAQTNQAAMVFERFIELIMPPDEPLFGSIIYIPGNHDHHIWEIARETQYVNYISKFDPGDYLSIPWHTTNMFIEKDPALLSSYFLTGLVKRYPHLKDFHIHVAYPNFGIVSDRTCVVFHHGHFIEFFYQLMSKLKNMLLPDYPMPSSVYDIEAENFAWIDFFWSTMGRSGEIGGIVESIYEKMRDQKQFKQHLAAFADNLAEQYDLPGWGDWMEAKFLKPLLYYLADDIARKERTVTAEVLSRDVEEGFRIYMEGPVRTQILTECKRDMPADVSFVFGHTHKPFQKDMNFRGYPRWVNVYNTGGWVVDTIELNNVFGGAVALVDENLDVISIRMFNQMADPDKYSVRVEGALHPGETVSPFYRRIHGLVEPSQDPWKSFSTIISRELEIRMQNLKSRISYKE